MKRIFFVFYYFILISFFIFPDEYHYLLEMENDFKENVYSSELCVKKYGEPKSKEIKKAKDFFPLSVEGDYILFLDYTDFRFIYFISPFYKKNYLYSFFIFNNYNSFCPRLSYLSKIEDVFQLFGNKKINEMTSDLINYGLDDGSIQFFFAEEKLIKIYWITDA